MEKVTLAVKQRKELGKKTHKIKREGFVPAVVYGKGIESCNLWVYNLDFKKLLARSGESVIIDLDIKNKENRSVLIHEIQRDPVSDKNIHVDFFQVRMDEKITTEVEVVLTGESPAVKEQGGVLVKNLDKVSVECLPGDLPSMLLGDISKIKTFEDHLCVKDLNIPKGVDVDADMETVVASVAPPRTEEELSGLEKKVEADVTKVEGVVKEEAAPTEEKKEMRTRK